MNETVDNKLLTLDKLINIDVNNNRDTTREYELEINKFVDENTMLFLNGDVAEARLDELLTLSTPNRGGAYNIFYALITYHRRGKNLSTQERLIEDYTGRFRKYFHSFKFLVFLLAKQRSPEEKKTLSKGEELMANEMFTSNSGVIHAYVETVAEYVESDIKNRCQDKQEQIKQAIVMVNEIINSSHYPKFYCTRGRLLFLDAINDIYTKTNNEDKYIDAIKSISIAIDKEPSSSSYAIRISQYQFFINEGQRNYGNALLFHRIEEGQKEIDYKMSRINIKNLEFIGFFIAVISFTLGSLQLASKGTVMETAMLIMTLMSTLLIAFSAFGFILHGVKYKSRTIANTIVALLGVSMLFFALYYLSNHI